MGGAIGEIEKTYDIEFKSQVCCDVSGGWSWLLDVSTLRTDDRMDRRRVAYFWASWCNPCVNELPLLNEAYKLSDVEMLAINVGENKETAQKFVDRYELEFPIVLDSDLNIKQNYQVVGMPLTVLIDEDGTMVERHEGELTEMEDILNFMARIKRDEKKLLRFQIK